MYFLVSLSCIKFHLLNLFFGFLQKPITDRLGEAYENPAKVVAYILYAIKQINVIVCLITSLFLLSRQNWHCNCVGPLENTAGVADLTKMQLVNFLRAWSCSCMKIFYLGMLYRNYHCVLVSKLSTFNLLHIFCLLPKSFRFEAGLR